VVFGLHILQFHPLSPVDEIHHVDYVYHLMHGELLPPFDPFTHDGQHALACRGIDQAFEMPCSNGPYDLAGMPEAGHNTAGGHTPLYYLVPTAAALLAKTLGMSGDHVTAMRLTGILWWALFALIAWRLFRELGVNRWVGAAGLLLAGASPVILQAHVWVNNDATTLVAGAAMTLAALRFDRGTLRLRWLVLLAAVAVALKVTNLLVVVAVALFLLIRHWQQHGLSLRTARPAVRATLIGVALLGAASVLVSVAWAAFSSSLGSVDPLSIPQNEQFHVTHFKPEWLISSLGAFLTPLHPEFIDSVLASRTAQFAAALTNYGLMSLAVLGAVFAAPRGRIRALAGACGISALLGTMIFVLIDYVVSHTFVLISARYGLCLVPMMLALGLTAVRGKPARTGIVVVGLGAILAMARVILV